MTNPLIRTTIQQTDGSTILTTTARITLNAGIQFQMPTWARELESLRVSYSNTTTLAAMGMLGKLDILSNDAPTIAPFEVLAPPIGSVLGTTGGSVAVKGYEEYEIHMPLHGGERMDIGGKNLVSPTTIVPRMAVELTVSNKRSFQAIQRDLDGSDITAPYLQQKYATNNPAFMYKPQVHAKIGTATQTGLTAASPVAGTLYQPTGATTIKEVYGAVTPGVVTTAEGLSGFISFVSTDFEGTNNVYLNLAPTCGGLGTLGIVNVPGVTRKSVTIPVKSLSAISINDSLTMASAQTATGYFVDGVIYE